MTNRKRTALYRALGRSIRDRRIESGLTQGDLARRLGLSTMAVSHMENGNRAVTLCRLADLERVLGAGLWR